MREAERRLTDDQGMMFTRQEIQDTLQERTGRLWTKDRTLEALRIMVHAGMVDDTGRKKARRLGGTVAAVPAYRFVKDVNNE